MRLLSGTYLSLRDSPTYHADLLGWDLLLGLRYLPIIGAFIEKRYVAGKGYLEEGYSVP